MADDLARSREDGTLPGTIGAPYVFLNESIKGWIKGDFECQGKRMEFDYGSEKAQ